MSRMWMTFAIWAAGYQPKATATKTDKSGLAKQAACLEGSKTWRNKHISLNVKVRLYESLVMSTVLYSAELWTLSSTQKKKTRYRPPIVSATTSGHYMERQSTKRRHQKSDKVTKNGPYHQRTKIEMAGRVLRVGDDRIPKQAMYWQMESQTRRKLGRPRMNWIDTVARDLKSIGIDWDEAEQAAVNRKDWRERVAQCVFDTG